MRSEKTAIIEEIRTKVKDSGFVLLVNYRGLKVARATELRKRLKAVGARFSAVNSSMFSIVARERGWKKLPDSLSGQAAIVTGTNEVGAAKVLRDFSAEDGKPVILAGALGADVMSAADIKQLADLPPREVLLGQVVGTIAAPMTRLVGVLNQKLSSILYVLKAIESKKA